MHPFLRNSLAVAAGIIVCMSLNMGIISISHLVIPPPLGADMMTPEGLEAAMPLLEPKHFFMPFLAHAFGTLAGSYVASLLAINYKMRIAVAIGAFHLIGGITAAFMIPAPSWFIATDLLFAYLPVAYLAGKINAFRR